MNWKKVGLSRAYFQKEALTEESMPTFRARAAFKYLIDNNRFYKAFWTLHNSIVSEDKIRTISSFDLFIVHDGIEAAMFPWMYPEAGFTDTGMATEYRERSGDDTARIFTFPIPTTHTHPSRHGRIQVGLTGFRWVSQGRFAIFAGFSRLGGHGRRKQPRVYGLMLSNAIWLSFCMRSSWPRGISRRIPEHNV